MTQTCPYCGAESRLLFNILVCTTPKCRNFDEVWAKEWLNNHGPQFGRFQMSGTDNMFLGRFQGTTNGTKFDMYSCKALDNNTEICIAKFGNLDDQAYYVDSNETEIGIVGSGPIHNVSKDVLEALKQALAIFRKRHRIKKP